MQKPKLLEEDQYKVDFMISEGYIKFSSELLRLSLIAMGVFGTLVLIRIKGEAKNTTAFLEHPNLFLTSMFLFALCSAFALFHRYYASDCMSWYIAWLRAKEENDEKKAAKEQTGFHKLLKLAKYSLIISEISFGGGVLLFMVAIITIFY